jgi:hypothetical protein
LKATYTKECKLIVKFGHHKSSKLIISTGVPQGSILGPLLFLLYINDIENCSKIISFVMYADDTNAFHSDKCLKSLTHVMQEEINEVIKWLNVNKLSINTTKTKYTRSYYRKENAADMYMQDVLQPKSVFFTVCFDLHQLPRTIVSHISSYKSAL